MSAPRATVAPVAARAAAFINYLHDDQTGFLEIVAGETDPADPRKIKFIMSTRRWFYRDPERPDLLEQAAGYAAQLADTHGNVYCSVRLYERKARDENKRSEAYAKPSRVIFIDDAPAAPSLPYSASIRTSEHSRHAYYKCDKPVTKDDARRAAAALGGDPSGADLTQVVRIPGTVNTKHGDRWPVAAEPSKRAIYSLDQLRAAFPPVSGSETRMSGTSWGEAYHAEQWQNLPDGEPLWHSAYIAAAAQRRAARGEPELTQLLRAKRVTLIKKDDTRDDSDSAQVAALAYNLLSANICKPQARAIADYLYPQIRPSKTREHYRAHFDAELERYTPKHYKPQEIRSIGAANKATPQPLPPAEYKPEPKSRARKDRPQRVNGAAGYLDWLHTQVDPQSGSVMLSQSQCAARIGCCVRTIKRYEKTLGTQIERRVFAQRQAGCLFILASDVVPTSAENVVIATTEIAQPNAENVQSATVQVEHTRPPVPQPPAVAESVPAPARLADLVREAFDLVQLDRETGEKRKATRKRLLIALGPLTRSDSAIDRAIANERQRRRIAAIVANIRGMKPPTLRQQIRLMERLVDKSREQGTSLHRFADWAAGEMRAELASRPAEPNRKPRKNCEVLPDPRAAGQRYQTELLDFVEQVRSWPAPIAGSVGGGVFPPTPPAAAGPPAGTVSSLLAGIARYHAQQAGAQ